jgi:chromatin segregation and condensation protein Rec8/ScpA/Scc1 (kleisin family)
MKLSSESNNYDNSLLQDLLYRIKEKNFTIQELLDVLDNLIGQKEIVQTEQEEQLLEESQKDGDNHKAKRIKRKKKKEDRNRGDISILDLFNKRGTIRKNNEEPIIPEDTNKFSEEDIKGNNRFIQEIFGENTLLTKEERKYELVSI